MFKFRLSSMAAASLIAATALGHDLWLEPSTFRPAAGTPLAIRLMVGDHFHGDPMGRHQPRIEAFVMRDTRGQRDVPGRQGGDPAGTIEVRDGTGMIGYRSRPLSHGTMSVKRFEAYLREEGLEHVIERRKASGSHSKPGREIYSRSAKAFLGSGSEREGFDVPLGFRLEIIPETNPAADGDLRVRVEFEGRPVSGVRVSALHKDAAAPISARSDAGGRVVLPLKRGGSWLVKAVHMIEASEGSGAEWESIWASLVFERAS